MPRQWWWGTASHALPVMVGHCQSCLASDVGHCLSCLTSSGEVAGWCGTTSSSLTSFTFWVEKYAMPQPWCPPFLYWIWQVRLLLPVLLLLSTSFLGWVKPTPSFVFQTPNFSIPIHLFKPIANAAQASAKPFFEKKVGPAVSC
eukprot:1160291-Pelagomonas_calceolata.AAC.11